MIKNQKISGMLRNAKPFWTQEIANFQVPEIQSGEENF